MTKSSARCFLLGSLLAAIVSAATAADQTAAPARQLNNLTSTLLEVDGIGAGNHALKFSRPLAGWVFVSASCQGRGAVKIVLDQPAGGPTLIERAADGGPTSEAFRHVAAGEHQLDVSCQGDATIEKLVVRSIPELIHCGLGFNPAIKSYGAYDLEFLKRDILPNVTTLVVPSNIQLPPAVIDDWHRQGKRFIAEVGFSGDAKTADEYVAQWTGHFDKSPWLDGILINEFIVNNASNPRDRPRSPERQQRYDEERGRYPLFEQALKHIATLDRYRAKTVYAYFGGSGKKLSQEMIGKSFVRSLLDSRVRLTLERYLFEVSSQQKSQDALQQFVEGIADWESKEPGAKRQMVVAFGLFSMPPGGINKLPNVDYHVWMDQQMQTLATAAPLAGIDGIEWWTTSQTDEETTRFVGRLYRHYAIEGRTDLLTRDPLFLAHITNADFERGVEGWDLKPAEPGNAAAGQSGSIEPKSFPRYGRIEGRYMGLGRPADPEHIGDTFLWMKRSAKGPNTFSQQIKGLEPGRLYSLKMYSCDYQDLVHPQQKTQAEATGFIGRVQLDNVEDTVDVDRRRSFHEIYSSSPEPPIPVWITYHWQVFRAKGPTAKVTVSDWPEGNGQGGRQGKEAEAAKTFGQEQTFNFLEIEPYWE